MDENEITQRLRDAGDQPVPGEVRATHLSQMHAATPAAVHQPKRFGRLAVAAAAFVGFAVGSTGFAMAGALPDPAQGVAHDVLAVVQVQVPDRPDNHGKCVSSAAKIADPSDKQAAKDLCKESHPPGRSGEAPGRSGEAPGRKVFPPDHPNGDDNDCTGKPPWAGKKGGPTPEERSAREACPPGLDEEPEELEMETEPAPGAEQRQTDPQAEAPAGPPDDGAPGQQDQGTTPPVEPPSETETEAETDTETETETETETG